jgi:hypothetical protein
METIIIDKNKIQYKIYKIWDNGGFDRYTVTFKYQIKDNTKYKKLMANYKMLECLCLSDNCNMPNGFSQWSSCQDGKHLGELIDFENLPENVQNHIKNRMKD